MSYLFPQAVSPRWSGTFGDDFERMLLNEPLRQFVEDKGGKRFVTGAVRASLHRLCQQEVQPPTASARRLSVQELEALRDLVEWSQQTPLSGQFIPGEELQIQQALRLLAEHVAPEDGLCSLSDSLSRIDSQEKLEQIKDCWKQQSPSFCLQGTLTAARLEAFHTLSEALGQWKSLPQTHRGTAMEGLTGLQTGIQTGMQTGMHGGLSAPPAVILGQWRLILSLLRDPTERQNQMERPQILREVRKFLAPSLLPLQKRWELDHSAEVSAASSEADAVSFSDFPERLRALRSSPLAEGFSSAEWACLERVATQWQQGEAQPPLAYFQLQELLQIKRGPCSIAAVDQQQDLSHRVVIERPVTDWDRKIAKILMRSQQLQGSAGRDGRPIPLLRQRWAGSQCYKSDTCGWFRERFARTPSPLERDTPTPECDTPSSEGSTDVLGRTTPLSDLERPGSARSYLEELFQPVVLSSGFLLLNSDSYLLEAVAAEERVVSALTTHNPDCELAHQAMAEFLAEERHEGGEWRAFLLEALRVYGSHPAYREALEPLLLIPPQNQEKGSCSSDSAPIEGEQALADLFLTVATHLEQFDDYLTRCLQQRTLSFEDHQEAWTHYLCGSSAIGGSSWALAHFLASGIKGLQQLEGDQEAFDGALEALGEPSVRRIALPLQRLYGQGLLRRAASDTQAQQWRASLQQLLGQSGWAVRWATLREAIG